MLVLSEEFAYRQCYYFLFSVHIYAYNNEVDVCRALVDYSFYMQTISYMAERVVGHGSFGIVFQVCLIFA